ncbi:MAG TPA: ferric reductase-like transmembrane domain-containing protein [Marmoricola sp.]|jgi:sulfoxide reductase heme-binding subunit YedZ|nr:ferric reductase-like transmembrane domain-containing protein [Marmoricola sp.]
MSAASLDSALWVLGRGTGIVALLLLTATLVLGITVRSRRSIAGLPRFGTAAIHKTASLTATGLIAVHVLTLLLDPQAGLKLVDLIVPFAGSYRPFYLGLGTLALELVVLVAATGMLRKRIGERTFHAIHLASYALWPVALGHALGTGSDAGSLWMDALAASCVAAVVAAGWWRLGPSFGIVKPTRSVAGATGLEHPEPLGAADLGGRVALLGEPGRQ